MGLIDFLTGNKKETKNNNIDRALLSASINPAGLERKYDVNEAGAYKQISTDNCFELYQQLETMTPHVAIPLQKLAQSVTKGMRFVSDDESLQKNFENWGKKHQFKSTIQTFCRLLARDGTYIAKINNKDDSENIYFEPLLMQYTTILPKGYDKEKFEKLVMTPPIDKIILNEGSTGNEKKYKPDEVVIATFCPYDLVIQDIKGRDTYGIYGKSMLIPISDIVFKYMDLVEGYTQYIKKYGIGRYAINYKLLDDLIKNGMWEDAHTILNQVKKEHQYIKENEDIISAGFDIKQLDTGGSNINVCEFKNSLETDIQIALLQQPLTMGRAEGTTYASGYVSEADRLIVLEGIQSLVENTVNQMIDIRLDSMNKSPGDVWIEFEDISRPEIEVRDLLDSYVNGLIDEEEYRSRTGFHGRKMATVEETVEVIPPKIKTEHVDGRKKKDLVEFNQDGELMD